MNWSEYLPLAEKTLSTQFHCDEKMQRVLHAVIGLATEIEELLANYSGNLDNINVLEELGDVEWYRSILWREYPELSKYGSEGFEKISDPFKSVLDLNTIILKLQDLVKKKIYYNKDIDENILVSLCLEMKENIGSYASYYNINLQDVWDINIAKLKARYGEKFTSDRAINRDLGVERTILENGK